jgi:hypothetical protein
MPKGPPPSSPQVLPSAATLAATEALDKAAFTGTVIGAQRQTPSIYSNIISLKLSATDFAILFSQEMPSTTPLRMTIQELALVNMSHGTMKILSENLSRIVKEVESILGPIKVASVSRPKDEQIEVLIGPLRALKIEE